MLKMSWLVCACVLAAGLIFASVASGSRWYVTYGQARETAKTYAKHRVNAIQNALPGAPVSVLAAVHLALTV
jgi:hypothetical protein